MPLTVKEILDIVNEIAPFETQEPWDNAGLLAGHPDMSVKKILLSLDLTGSVIDEAVERDAQLILTHHPILFHARKNLREDDPEGALLCKLIRSGRALIAAHTNFDAAENGVNDALCEALNLTSIQPLDSGLRMGQLNKTLRQTCELAHTALNAIVRPFGAMDARIDRLAVCGGAGGSLWRIAHEAGAQGYLTGEIKWSDALDATAAGLVLLEAGHYETEKPSIKALSTALQMRLNALQYNVMVFESGVSPF